MPTQMKLELQSSHNYHVYRTVDLTAVAVLVLAVAAVPAAAPKATDAPTHQPLARVPQPLLQKMYR